MCKHINIYLLQDHDMNQKLLIYVCFIIFYRIIIKNNFIALMPFDYVASIVRCPLAMPFSFKCQRLFNLE